MNKLQPVQLKRFEALEQVCINGRAVFYMVGMALDEIKREKFYESKGFDSFPEYCESIGYSKRYCNDMIIGAKVVAQLPDNLRNLVQSERAARALLNIPASLRIAVAIRATSAATKPATVGSIKSASAGPPPRPPQASHGVLPAKPALTPPKSLQIKAQVGTMVPISGPNDKTGIPVPTEVMHTWERREEVATLLTDLSKVRTALRKAKGSGDNLFAEVDFTDNEAKLSMVYEDLQTAMPYAVCPECNGKINVASCGVCGGRGFVSEFYWKVKVPNDIKEITGRK